MIVDVTTQGEIAIVVLTGEIDGKTAPDVKNSLSPVIASYKRIVIDMSKVTFLSSAGLRVLLLLYRQANARNGKVALAGLAEPIQEVMKITGFLSYFHVATSLQAGIEAVQ